MQAIEFPQQHDIIAKDQPEYLPLPVHFTTEKRTFIDGNGQQVEREVIMEMTACFKLSPEEIAQIVATQKLWYTQCVFGQQFQPIRMSVLNPFEEAPNISTDMPPRTEADIIYDFRELLKRNAGIRSQLQDAIAREAFNSGVELAGNNDVVFEVSEKSLALLGNMAGLNFLHKFCGDPEALGPVSSPAEPLKKALVEDRDYWEGWRANLAAAFIDEFNGSAVNDDMSFIVDVANRAADNFLNQLCNEKVANNSNELFNDHLGGKNENINR